MSRIQNSSSSGTLVYMSPEQLRGEDIGKESDIYSFGSMLYELLSGHPPFYKGAIEYQIFNEPVKPLEQVSEGMNRILQKCLAKDYRERYRGFMEVIDALEGRGKAGEALRVKEAGQAEITQMERKGFLLVEAGSFSIGSTTGDKDEKPVHWVTISRSFHMSQYEVTQKQWREVMGSNPSHFKRYNLPGGKCELVRGSGVL